ncbi:MAG: protein kinase [Phycisphaerales bacterium]|nr:protein kinase [Phycisphaerales bacterium]
MMNQIGPYSVTRELGRGGMGVVYLATDTRLDREVAIKALPPELASDPARLERFEREAKTLAQLNHPNLAGIHGIEEQDGAKYLVLEFVEGQSLADRLDRGPIPIDEAVEYAIQIAAGIEAAHEAGVIHRDLKPANIIVTPDGKAKVLDFGLARTDEGGQSSTGGLDSPTITTPLPQHSPTIEGAILGTAAYMSPEQARGRRIDKRTDIWSFGVVFYEMLVGASPFVGETASDSIGAVLHKSFDLTQLPSGTPLKVRWVLERCLERDKNIRLQSIGDARIELERKTAPTEDEHSQGSRLPLRTVILGSMFIAAAACAATWWAVSSNQPEQTKTVRKINVMTSDESDTPWNMNPVISPDGQRIAFIRDEQIYVRALDDFEAIPLPGTEGVKEIAWSRDSRDIAFRTREHISVMYGGTGTPYRVMSNPHMQFQIAWTDDGRIITNIDGTTAEENSKLISIPAIGGSQSSILESDPEVTIDYHSFAVIPGTDVVVYQDHRKDGGLPLMASDGERTVKLVEFDNMLTSTCTWSPSGHVLFMRGFQTFNELWAIPFSPHRMEATGEPFLVMPDVRSPSVSADGTLAVIRSSGEESGAWGGKIGWLTPDGEFEMITEAESDITKPLPSPDGSLIAFTMGESQARGDIWVHEFERGFNRRITKFNDSSIPISWSPDGSELMVVRYTMANSGRFRTHFLAADGSGETRKPYEGIIIESDPTWTLGAAVENMMTPNVRLVAIDLMDYSIVGTIVNDYKNPNGFVAISPDGAHILISDRSSGQSEVYCLDWPSGMNMKQVSTVGGQLPVWSPDGNRIIFISADNSEYLEVDVTREPEISFSRPRTLFESDVHGGFLAQFPELEPSHDGSKYAVVRRGEGAGEQPPFYISIIENWEASTRKKY